MEVITTTHALEAACRRLSSAPYVAVDTEFIRDTTFWPRLCLIQMAGPEGDPTIIDAMAEGIDLAPFYALMADESLVKVFHAARQDIEIIYHRAGLIPHPLFDTQVAAAVCGHGESVSFEQLARNIAGVQIDKSHRFTDWARRPLSKSQLAYAASDVIHLRPIYNRLSEEVERFGRGEWIREEMNILTSPATYGTDPENAWKRLKLKVRKPRELALMKALATWREREAQSRDVPRGRIIKDEALYEIALHAPQNETELARLRAVPTGFERSARARAIIEIVREVNATPAEELPPIPKKEGPQRTAGPVADLLKVLLKHIADANRVAPRLIASSEDIEAIAADDEADIAMLHGWRREIFGEQALALKQGRLSLAIQGERVVLEPREAQDPPPKVKRRRPRRRNDAV